MASRRFAIGFASLIGAMAIASAVSTTAPHHILHASVSIGPAHLRAVGSRSVEQRQSASNAKLDGTLADLARHASLVRSGSMFADLHSLSPAARFSQSTTTGAALIAVDAVTRGDPQQLKAALQSLGLEHASVYSNDVGGYLPVTEIEAAAARGELVSLRAALSRARATGPVSTQGDYVQRSNIIRSTYPALTGTGITVGVLSVSFDCYSVYAANGVPASGNEGYAYNGFTADYSTDVSTGALPSGVDVLEEAEDDHCMSYGAPDQPPFNDEGRAMLQIVHDIAPDASLAFYTGETSEADFAAGIGALANAGAKVEADDLGYYDEPYFQDGIVAQAIDAVEAKGVAYFSAAGNEGSQSWYSTAPSFSTLSSTAPNAGEMLLNFDTSGATTTAYLPVTIPPIPPGDYIGIVLQWDQPYVTGASSSGGATSQLDLCVTGGSGGDTIVDYDNNTAVCSGPNAIGTDPYQVMIIGNPANATGNTAQQTFNITVGLVNGTRAPGRVIVTVEDDGLGISIDQFATHSGTIQGHPNAAGAAAVGAAFYFQTPRCGTTPAELEFYSSVGGTPILFSTAGARLATPVVRQKPDFVGPDGANSTFLGYTLADAGDTGSNGLLSTSVAECQNLPSYPNFFGTSAATPHVAGIAALLMQANSTAATPTAIYDALRSSADPMAGATPNYSSGYGFVQADLALALIPPGPPTLAFGSSSVVVGHTTTLTWSSTNAQSCTASGSWSGSLSAGGTQTITAASTAGSDTYSLTCTNSAGTSAAATATLTVTTAAAASSGGGGGGGALGGASLLGLAALGLVRHARRALVARPNRRR